MNIQSLLKELDKLHIPTDKMAITSSGPMGVRNIREINDLDIIVTPDIWTDLSKKYTVKKENNFKSINIGNIQILGEGSFFTDPEYGDLKSDIQNADVIGGYRYVKLDKILKIKRLKKREKDIKDVKLIEKYLNEKTQ